MDYFLYTVLYMLELFCDNQFVLLNALMLFN